MLDSISEDAGLSQITKIISLAKNDAEKEELKENPYEAPFTIEEADEFWRFE